jgi:hypothetical protein
MVMSPARLGTNNDCAGEARQQFTGRKPVSRQSIGGQIRRLAVLSRNVSSRYLPTTSEQAEDFMCAVVVVTY